jgi:ribonuclease P protein component
MKNNCNSFSNKKQITLVKKTGKTIKNATFYFTYTLEQTPTTNLFYALSVSKKNFKLAVTRNRIKNHLRIFLRNSCQTIETKTMYLIINVSKSYINNTYEKNEKMFNELMNKIK